MSEFKKKMYPQDMFKAKQLGFSPLEYITLASIVEKETAVSSERERVAGVYFNRLKIKNEAPSRSYGYLWYE